MQHPNHGVIGVGYESTDLDAFVASLVGWKVLKVFDVRLTPSSRKRGFTKRALSQALEDAGIAYEHLPQLGNPRDNRAGYGFDSSTDEGKVARTEFAKLLTGHEARAALDSIVDDAEARYVAVMCYEESELHCHRKQVLDAVRRRLVTD